MGSTLETNLGMDRRLGLLGMKPLKPELMDVLCLKRKDFHYNRCIDRQVGDIFQRVSIKIYSLIAAWIRREQ